LSNYYKEVKELLSHARLTSYQQAFGGSSDQELLGAYDWNMSLVGALMPLLQITEVTLRNAIHNAANTEFGDRWFEKPKFNHQKGSTKKPEAVKNFKKNISASNKEAAKVLKRQKITGKPSSNQVIAQTSFSTWEFILDDAFFKGGDDRYIWPKCLGVAFENWPSRKASASLRYFKENVKSIRLLRNRISHHEPVWKHHTVKSEMDAVEYMLGRVDAIERLLGHISASKLKHVKESGWIDLARSRCSLENLRYFQRNLPIKRVASWRQLKLLKSSHRTLVQLKSPGITELATPQVKKLD